MINTFWVRSVYLKIDMKFCSDEGFRVCACVCQLADVRLYIHGVAGKLTNNQMLHLALSKTSATLDTNYKCLESSSPFMKDQVRPCNTFL